MSEEKKPYRRPSLEEVFAKMQTPDDRPEVVGLLAAMKREMPALEKLLAECDDHWGAEDAIYRFYHQSYKVFQLQSLTTEVVDALKGLAPPGLSNEWTRMIQKETGKPAPPLNQWFLEIVAQGTGKEFEMKDNDNWLAVTRPIVEAFFHARYFLGMVVTYGKELEHPPRSLPSGWAAVLYLYNLR